MVISVLNLKPKMRLVVLIIFSASISPIIVIISRLSLSPFLETLTQDQKGTGSPFVSLA